MSLVTQGGTVRMPFDGVGFPPPRPERRPSRPGDNTVSVIIIAIAVTLLVMPISMAALVDVVRYLDRP